MIKEITEHERDDCVLYGFLAVLIKKPGATTDPEGLQAFGNNEDGVFDLQDDEWNSCGIWQDKKQ